MLSPSLLSSRELSSTNRRPSVLTGVIRNEIICVVILHHGYIPIIKIIFLYITGWLDRLFWSSKIEYLLFCFKLPQNTLFKKTTLCRSPRYSKILFFTNMDLIFFFFTLLIRKISGQPELLLPIRSNEKKKRRRNNAAMLSGSLEAIRHNMSILLKVEPFVRGRRISSSVFFEGVLLLSSV